MRILSQDGKIDLPYEKICLKIGNYGKIFAQVDICGVKENHIEIASYKGEAQARKAMEILHEKYECITTCFSHKGNMIPPKIFKFPSEYEIEKVLKESEVSQ